MRKVLFIILVLSYCQLVAQTTNGNNNYVVIIWGQSNANGYNSTSELYSPYKTNANCKIWAGSTWVTLDGGTANTNQYPSKNNTWAFNLPLAYITQNYTKGNFYIIQYAVGGTSLQAYWKYGALGYNALVTETNQALANLATNNIPYTIIGSFFYQGEADAASDIYAPLYTDTLDHTLTSFRTDIGVADLHYYLIRIHIDCPYTHANVLQVRAGDSLFVDTDAGNSEFVSVDDLTLTGVGSSHINSASQIILGQRLFNLFVSNLLIKSYNPK